MKEKKIIVLIILLVVISINTLCAKALLDDINYTILTEKEMQLQMSYAKRLIYKNSNWSKIPLTSEFLSKYNPKDGLVPELNVSYISIPKLSKNTYRRGKILEQIKLCDESYIYIILNLNYNSNNEIYDASIIYISKSDYSLTPTEIYNKY